MITDWPSNYPPEEIDEATSSACQNIRVAPDASDESLGELAKRIQARTDALYCAPQPPLPGLFDYLRWHRRVAQDIARYAEAEAIRAEDEDCD